MELLNSFLVFGAVVLMFFIPIFFFVLIGNILSGNVRSDAYSLIRRATQRSPRGD